MCPQLNIQRLSKALQTQKDVTNIGQFKCKFSINEARFARVRSFAKNAMKMLKIFGLKEAKASEKCFFKCITLSLKTFSNVLH